jgi:hypothetical protein
MSLPAIEQETKIFYVYDYLHSFGHSDNLEQVKQLQKETHAQFLDQYHEVHEKGLGGRSQLEPDDCWNCGRNIHKCSCQGLGYSLTDCLGNCIKNVVLKKQCHNTNCAYNPWFSGFRRG